MKGLVVVSLLVATVFQAESKGFVDSCCKSGQVSLDLSGTSGPALSGQLEGVTFMESSLQTSYPGQACQNTALVKVNFERLVNCTACVQSPMCGRRMLLIDLTLATSASGWVFNVGDSRTNNGWAGDAVTQDNDGEIQGLNAGITAYNSDVCGSTALFNLPDELTGVSNLKIYVSNENVRITSDRGLDYNLCTRCLHALNGQSDTGGVNEDIYIALNRVVSGVYRNGYGVCSARLSWVCPWASAKLLY